MQLSVSYIYMLAPALDHAGAGLKEHVGEDWDKDDAGHREGCYPVGTNN